MDVFLLGQVKTSLFFLKGQASTTCSGNILEGGGGPFLNFYYFTTFLSRILFIQFFWQFWTIPFSKRASVMTVSLFHQVASLWPLSGCFSYFCPGHFKKYVYKILSQWILLSLENQLTKQNLGVSIIYLRFLSARKEKNYTFILLAYPTFKNVQLARLSGVVRIFLTVNMCISTDFAYNCSLAESCNVEREKFTFGTPFPISWSSCCSLYWRYFIWFCDNVFFGTFFEWTK